MITLHLLYQVEYYNCMYVTFNLQYLQSALMRPTLEVKYSPFLSLFVIILLFFAHCVPVVVVSKVA